VIGMLNEWGRKSGRIERKARWKVEGTNEKAVLSALESTGRPTTVYEIRASMCEPCGRARRRAHLFRLPD
jgi:hypothetical protein